MNADRRYKLIRKIETATARVHDSQHFESVLDQTNTSSDVYADWGYPSQARESDLKASGYRPQIHRKGTTKRKLPECQQRRNQKIGEVRARVEHGFAAITQIGGKLTRMVGQARADFGMTMVALCSNIKRLTYLKTTRIKASRYLKSGNGARNLLFFTAITKFEGETTAFGSRLQPLR